MDGRLISRWAERLLVTALTVIALYRLGPQSQALKNFLQEFQIREEYKWSGSCGVFLLYGIYMKLDKILDSLSKD